MYRLLLISLVSICVFGTAAIGQAAICPYDAQVAANLDRLGDASTQVRARAAESLGFLRAYSAEGPLVERLGDESPEVRRQVAMALGWCGGRKSVPPLLKALDDDDWLVRQGAHVALTNITGMEFPFRSTDPSEKRAVQVKRWRDWWATVPADRPPKEVLELLGGTLLGDAAVAQQTGPITASSTYKGPPNVLLDGRIGPAYWQTKNVKFPQWVCVDLGKPKEISRVTVHQYSDQFVMTDYELATSLDNKKFDVVKRHKGVTPARLVATFPKRKARYVRITSFDSANRTYPTTFFEIEIDRPNKLDTMHTGPNEWRLERGLRALGALGGEGATEAVLGALGANPSSEPRLRPAVRAGIRSLGRLKDEAGFEWLVAVLGNNTMWARCAAEALGDFGDRRAVAALLAAYPKYAKDINGRNPRRALPRDDKMGFPSEDRMLETPYYIVYSLCRLPIDNPKDRAALRQMAPLIMANLPGDHDTFMLYEPEVGHLLTDHLIEQTGLRQEACEIAMTRCGQPRRVESPDDGLAWSKFPAVRISCWLPCVCKEKEDLPRLLALLEHKDGWVRLNAAKAIAWLGDRRAIEPVAKILREAKNEAGYGYNGTFKNEEYNDPAPRWREGPIRVLGLLGAHEQTDLLVKILTDEGSVAEIRHAAASALGDLIADDPKNETAVAALKEAALNHSFHCVRHIARDALRSRGINDVGAIKPRPLVAPNNGNDGSGQDEKRRLAKRTLKDLDAIIFIKGSNDIPNTKGTVEQADRWRQTYVVTDSGPVYRPGRNLYVLRPPRPDGKVTPLTTFPDGYVAEPEMSWDGSHVLFTRRGQDDPWWHVWRINTDGTGLKQITRGPYHDVGPAYLPDGRIVFTSSRLGIRDEYHGYPCTALWVMNADGSDPHPIATNIGRDNEPAVLNDGRVAFSRLEVFYSRNKTELTLHAMHPDGTKDVVLYGPERRQFWRSLDHGPRTPADGQEAPLTHRVLRMTQPQPMPDGRHIIVATQGGFTLIGQRRDREEIITPDNKTRAYTTPLPLPDGTVLCAASAKTPDRKKVDLGLYLFDPATKEVRLIYNDPATADFEPRPIMARPRPMVHAAEVKRHAYSGQFVCSSVFATQEKHVPLRGRLVRLIEGVPVIARHSTHTNPQPVWKNHGGTFARVLGMAPLAPDGSFCVEVPADRLMHFQVLDSDRRVIGNQKTWIYPRPGERKSCVGCHEDPHTTSRGNDPIAIHFPPVKFLPNGDEFTYRAKAWFKGHLPGEIEERTRTVRAVNLLGR